MPGIESCGHTKVQENGVLATFSQKQILGNNTWSIPQVSISNSND
jgi:hypothetical protein